MASTNPNGTRQAEQAAEGIHYATGEKIRVRMKDGRIAAIETFGKPNANEGSLPFIGPGLVDLQVNGCFGFDFNTLPLAAETVAGASRAVWQQGVTSFYPTVITNAPEAIEEAVAAIAAVCESDPLVGRTIAGIHVEGPFISPEDGARGAHALQYVREPDWEIFLRWQKASGGRIKILTLSPEWPNSADFIAKCSASGVTVSIGHTAATPEQIQAAVRAGARMSTHLGNGAHLMLPRHPNYIWEQLAQDDLWSCVIADGFHLPDSVLKVVIKAKGERAMVVSDAVYLSGMAPGEYETHIGGKVVLTPEGRLHTAGNPKILAGSAQMLPWNIKHLLQRGLADLPLAWEMASVRPARFMGLEAAAGLAAGAPADVVLFDRQDGGIRILRTYKEGIPVYEAGE